MSGEGVAQGVAGDPLRDSCRLRGPAYRALEDGLVEMMPASLAGGGVDVLASRWEDPLPEPLAAGVGELGVQGVGELDPARATLEVCAMLASDLHELPLEGLDCDHRQQGDAIAVALATANDDLPLGEIEILHPQACTLEESEARSVEERRHEPRRADEMVEKRADLTRRENGRKASRSSGAHDSVE